MNEAKIIPVATVKSENFFSTDVTEYQYHPFQNENGKFVALTFFRSDVEADISSTGPKIFVARKAVCTLSLNLEVAKLLADHLNSLVNIAESAKNPNE